MPEASAPDQVATTSANLVAEQIERLKSIFPEVVTEGKVDFDKLKATLGEHVDDRPERYDFTWAGKQDAIKLLQSESTATLKPDRDASVNFDETRNVFIEGENLETLKLLYKAYFGRVKMIYIDPPYNTGEDMIYDDDFSDSGEAYLARTGQKDASGNLLRSNPETSGRYHSDWLSMMYPRLFLARQLLREDGVIFVSIDDAEVANLRLLMDEVFGEENFLATFVWKRRSGAMDAVDNVSTDHEYVLCYSRNPTALTGEARTFERYSNPDNDPRGPWVADNLSAAKAGGDTYYPIEDPETGFEYWPPKGRYWPYNPKKMQRKIEEGRILFPGTEDGSPMLKRFKNEARSLFRPVSTWIAQPGNDEQPEEGFVQMISSINSEGTREIKSLFGDKVFSYPKPTSLLKALVEQGTTGQDDIVLDFFAGSCTTAQAVLEVNREDGGSRRHIMVQFPEQPDSKSPAGKNNYDTIADLGKERLRRVSQRMKKNYGEQLELGENQDLEDLGFRVLKLTSSHFATWDSPDPETSAEEYARQMELINDPLRDDWETENVIYEIAIKEGLCPLLHIEQVPDLGEVTVWKVTDLKKERTIYVSLDESFSFEGIKPLDLETHDTLICRDVALSDTAAANLALQCTLKTI